MRFPYVSEITIISSVRLLIFSTGEAISSVRELLQQANSFELVGHEGVWSFSDFNLRNIGTLKVCVVEGGRIMTSLWMVLESMRYKHKSEKNLIVLLEYLEKLYFFELQTLHYIWRGSAIKPSKSERSYAIWLSEFDYLSVMN